MSGMSARIPMSDEEAFLLANIEGAWHQNYRLGPNALEADEMRCQRDMRIRGRRLWRYHLVLGDLWDILGIQPIQHPNVAMTITDASQMWKSVFPAAFS